MRVLIKIGGTLLDSIETRRKLASEIRDVTCGGAQAVVVHGGGKQMTRFLTEHSVESRFIDGLRVTTPEVLDAVLKVLAGSVNRALVAALIAAGVNAVGLSGMDALLTEAEPMSRDLGFVGRPVRSNPALLELLTTHQYLPVVACVAGDRLGNFYNVNADQMAVACAASFQASKLLFLTDVDGVRGRNDVISPELTVSECRSLIDDGIATGGMRAKLDAAIAALDQGVSEVTIAPGVSPGVLKKLLSGEPVGTRLMLEELKVSHNE